MCVYLKRYPSKTHIRGVLSSSPLIKVFKTINANTIMHYDRAIYTHRICNPRIRINSDYMAVFSESHRHHRSFPGGSTENDNESRNALHPCKIEQNIFAKINISRLCNASVVIYIYIMCCRCRWCYSSVMRDSLSLGETKNRLLISALCFRCFNLFYIMFPDRIRQLQMHAMEDARFRY